MSRVFDFVKRRPKKVDQVVRFKSTPTGSENDETLGSRRDTSIMRRAEELALLENANEHTEYRKLQARYNVPNSEILKAYHRLGIA